MAGNITPGDRISFLSPTPTQLDSQQAATVQVVSNIISTKVVNDSPELEGMPLTTTPDTLDISNAVANVEYVHNVINGMFQPITPPLITVPQSVISQTSNHQLIITGSVSQRSPIVRYRIQQLSGFTFEFSKTTNIIDGQIVLFNARFTSRDTLVRFNVIPTDGVLEGNPVLVEVLVRPA